MLGEPLNNLTVLPSVTRNTVLDFRFFSLLDYDTYSAGKPAAIVYVSMCAQHNQVGGNRGAMNLSESKTCRESDN